MSLAVFDVTPAGDDMPVLEETTGTIRCVRYPLAWFRCSTISEYEADITPVTRNPTAARSARGVSRPSRSSRASHDRPSAGLGATGRLAFPCRTRRPSSLHMLALFASPRSFSPLLPRHPPSLRHLHLVLVICLGSLAYFVILHIFLITFVHSAARTQPRASHSPIRPGPGALLRPRRSRHSPPPLLDARVRTG